MASSTIIIAALLLVTAAQAQDPTCSTGLRVAGACCPAECGTCGGPTCGPRGRMLGTMCCIGAIKNSGASCFTANPPCMITSNPPMESPMPMESPVVVETPMPPMETQMPMETPMMAATPMPPMETPMMAATPMPQETPMVDETPMPSMEVPMETAAPLPAVCTRMRSKFLGGCFCYLVFSGEIRVRMAKKFRPFCREIYGPRKKILSLVFTCRRFVNGSKAPTKVTNLINRLNTLIPRCTTDIPLIAIRG